MIDEKKLIERIRGMSDDCNLFRWRNSIKIKDGITSIIAHEPKIGEWIPCNERLPEKEGCYIATYAIANSEKMCHELYFDGETWIDEAVDGEIALPHAVFAWQPLPAPYEVESDD